MSGFSSHRWQVNLGVSSVEDGSEVHWALRTEEERHDCGRNTCLHLVEELRTVLIAEQE